MSWKRCLDRRRGVKHLLNGPASYVIQLYNIAWMLRMWLNSLNDLGGGCAKLRGRASDENRNQEDRKFRRPHSTARANAAVRPQTRSGAAHYRTRWRGVSGGPL